MNGRSEHEIKIIHNIDSIISKNPQCVERFYHKIRLTAEPTTCLEYLRKITLFLSTIDKDIHEITTTDLDDYFSNIYYITDKKGGKKRSSNAYRKSTYTALNTFFNFLYTRKEISTNPMELIVRPKNSDHVIRTSLDIDDFNKILLTIQKETNNEWKERDLLILYLFMHTGMRKTALSEINIQDINFEDNILIVIDKRNKRLLYNITDELKIIMINWLEKRKELLNGVKEDALFISYQLKRMSEKSVYNIVVKYSGKALGYSISPHKLRASFVTIFYQASGCDIKATCEAVGHSNIATTSLYVVSKNNSRKNAANFMSKNLIT